MNHAQNRQLHTLLSITRLMHEKANLVNGFTGGRSDSSKDLSFEEAADMIEYLQGERKSVKSEAANKMRRKVISLAYEMRWAKSGQWATALLSIDNFCKGEHGIYKKELQMHGYNELVQVVTQFESMYKKYLNAL
jgi:hypothetical protein